MKAWRYLELKLGVMTPLHLMIHWPHGLLALLVRIRVIPLYVIVHHVRS